ncbi:hypothetical protein B0A48_08672 [Cryoendolithus antarcticus]|uniref:Uncharacterized protein n=1 Tax=Cryoendolithus antarcticus TaxID=1507870 RepID=A0A1V8T449_9PEZI|nr:hypothetical protein B0A48_08672 [Cryoendolithus antarcticus]
MALNLEKQLQFYGAYHHNAVNVAIHVTCVPMIMMTAFLFATNTGAIPLPTWATVPNLPANLGTILATTYSGLYILMEPVAGCMLAPLIMGGTAYANVLTSTYPKTANQWALGLHIFSWVAQFVGHGVFEGRAPALLDNLVQALFLAPFFVWMEILFMFGYRPELKSRLDKAIEGDLQKLQAEKAAKQTNGHAKENRVQVMLNGTMKQDIAPGASIRVIANISAEFPPEDDTWNFCTWLDVEDEAETQCPPDKGETLLTCALGQPNRSCRYYTIFYNIDNTSGRYVGAGLVSKMGFDSMAAWDRNTIEANRKRNSRNPTDSAISFGSPTASPRSPVSPSTPSFEAATSRWSPPTSPTTSAPRSRHTSPTTSSSSSPMRCSFGSSPPPASSHRDHNLLASQLYAASCAGDIAHIELLLYLGAPINASTLVRELYTAFKPAKHGHLSPLAGAATHGQFEAAKLLIAHGAHVSPDIAYSSSAPLHQACLADDIEMVHFLLAAGTDINQQNTYKSTPIMYAARYASEEIVRLLLSYNPDLRITSMIGTNVIHWAMLPFRKESMPILHLLLEVGANPNMRMADDGTSLHYAAQSGLVEVVELLLAYGADRGARNQDWKTASEIAAGAGSEACVETLRKRRARRD